MIICQLNIITQLINSFCTHNYYSNLNKSDETKYFNEHTGIAFLFTVTKNRPSKAYIINITPVLIKGLFYFNLWYNMKRRRVKNNLRYKLNSKHFTQTGKKMNTGSKTKKRQSKKFSSNEIIFGSTFALYFLPVCLRFSLSFWKQIIAQHVSHSLSLINFHFFFFFCLHLSIYKG